MPRPQNIVNAAMSWLLYGVEHHHQYHYSQDLSGPNDRLSWHKKPVGRLPWTGDCSSHVAYVFWAAGGKDPSGVNFAYGNTNTLAAHGKEITEAELRPMDLVIYWDGATTAGPSGHVAVYVKKGPHGLLTISMGEEGDPNWCYVGPLGDTRPHKFYRYDTTMRAGVTTPCYAPTGTTGKKPPLGKVTGHVPTPPKVAPTPPTGPRVAPSVPFKPFGFGSMDPRVKQVQVRLISLGYGKNGLRPHLPYGPRTLSAVKAFKRDQKIQPNDSIVGFETWQKLGLH